MSYIAPPELIAAIRSKLETVLEPDALEVIDDSARHAEHREARGRFHLKVSVVSGHFRGLSRVERHRLVYGALSEELSGPLHALNLRARAPEE